MDLYNIQAIVMEEIIRKKCEEHSIPVEILTEYELQKLRKEIEAEQRGELVLDSILSSEKVVMRAIAH